MSYTEAMETSLILFDPFFFPFQALSLFPPVITDILFMNVVSDNHLITFVGSKCCGLVDADQSRLEANKQ
jgi:hypothetical protein